MSKLDFESWNDSWKPFIVLWDLQKYFSPHIGNLWIAMTMIKHEGIPMVNRLIKHVDFLKSRVNSNNELAVTVQTSYSSLSRNVERSYNTLYEIVINSLKYF